ncbi:hypothetical protein STEG23_030736 [Scotinomys teguina]
MYVTSSSKPSALPGPESTKAVEAAVVTFSDETRSGMGRNLGSWVLSIKTKQCGMGDDGHSAVDDKHDRQCLRREEQKQMARIENLIQGRKSHTETYFIQTDCDCALILLF